MKERYKLIPEVFVMILRGNSVFLARRANTGYHDGKYGMPGGHGEDRESVRQGAAREAREELGLTIDPEDLKLVLVQSRWCADPGNGHARIGFYFSPSKLIQEPRNAEPDKCDDVRFFPLDALPDNIVPHVRAALEAYKRGEQYTEFDWETL